MKNKGWAVHLHHALLVEYCYDYAERIKYIKSSKPEEEQPIRLECLKLLPKEAIAEIPDAIKKADAKCKKADAECKKAYTEWKKADAEWKKVHAEGEKVHAEWEKAHAEREKVHTEREKAHAGWDSTAWHTKWCGCKHWNGKELDFKR